jgi:antitoxin ParD1/3/4
MAQTCQNRGIRSPTLQVGYENGDMAQFRQLVLLTILAQNSIKIVMAQMNISLPEALKKWAETRVAEGRYSSTSDLIRDLLRKDQDSAADETAWLQAMIDEGLASETLEQDAFEVLEDIIAAIPAQREAA